METKAMDVFYGGKGSNRKRENGAVINILF